MNKLSKMDAFLASAFKYQHTFQCPKCRSSMALINKNLICESNHSFDISKKGYVNLLLAPHDSIYSKSLFQARQKTADAMVFHILMDAVAESINRLCGKESISILDAGCGEGSISAGIYKRLGARDIEFHGIDISKEGISIAGNCGLPILWSVGDLSNLPYKNEAFDVILNVLSPSNYSEFFRVMKKNSTMIKVVPGPGYLREFRNILFSSTSRASYSNQNVKDLFKKNLSNFKSQKMQYSFSPDELQLHNLIEMTPLLVDRSLASAEKEKLKKIQTISLDYEILTGSKT